MTGVFKRGVAARAIVAAVLLCGFLSVGQAQAQLARDVRGAVPNASIERPERPHPKQPPSFLKRLIAIVLGDQIDIPRP